MTVENVVFMHCGDLERLRYPDTCPFNTTRAGRTRDVVESMGLLSGDGRSEVEPQPLDRDRMETFHSSGYLDCLQAAAAGELGPEGFEMGLGTPDCPVFPDVYEYSALAAGATVTGAELTLDGGAHVVFNPSGGFHHAGPARAGGFCYINDIVLACLALTRAGRRVLFLDVDVHHCDGVQAAFYRRSDVMTLSLHESGRTLFPGTGFEREIGEGEGKGYSVNIPLPVGTYDGAFLRAFREAGLPLLRAFAPDIIVIELGMDALAGDPLAHCSLTNNAHAEVLELALNFGKPILATGGGGYNVGNTVRGWALMWSIMCGESAKDEMRLGLGGVMLEGTDWHGGLRDRSPVDMGKDRSAVDAAIAATVENVKRLVFPLHGL